MTIYASGSFKYAQMLAWLAVEVMVGRLHQCCGLVPYPEVKYLASTLMTIHINMLLHAHHQRLYISAEASADYFRRVCYFWL